jgi:ferredoxin
MKSLKKIRIALAIIFFIPIFLYLIDFTGKLPFHLHGLLHIQWIPALLTLNLIIIGVLFLLSLFFGRIYCSTICPLGVFQDVTARKSRFFAKKNKKKFRYEYVKPQNILRYSILALTVLLFIFGSSFLLVQLDPYSIFGRMISQIFRPLLIWGNNGLATILSGMGNYSVYKVEQNTFVPLAFGITLFFFLLIGLMAWFRGRLFCNTVCPVGTSLGLLSKISLFRISIKESSCNQCGACEKSCKSQCIDSHAMTVDQSRCVSCYNCLTVCKKSSMKYEFGYKKQNSTVQETPSNNGRRTFLLTSGAVVATLAVAKANTVTAKNDATLTRTPIMPPGAGTADHFNTKCTGCQLCVDKCPMQVLRPAVLQYGISGIMQPHLDFSTHVFCSYDCNICSTVCPTSALKSLPLNEKKLVQIGVAKFRKDKCIVSVDETDCGACSEHCPTQAVHMIDYKDGLTIPEVTESICIGCGACESICPAKPYAAIYVEGAKTQILANKPPEAQKFNKKVDDFGF